MILRGKQSKQSVLKALMIFLLFVILFSFASAQYADCNVYGNCKPAGTTLTIGGNYSINTNYSDNSGHLEGRDTSQLYNYFKSLFNSIYMFINGTNSNINFLQFNLTANETPAEGKLSWNDDDGTLNIGMKGGAVTLQVGQEILIRVKNDQGSILNDGQIVYIDSATGGNILVKLADADTNSSHKTIGMVTEQIGVGQHGYITSFGYVRDINTSLYPDGTPIYLSSVAGAYTDTIPPAPAHTVKIGTIINSHATEGTVLVNINNGLDLHDIDDVLITNPLNKQMLVYNSTSTLWENENTTIIDSVYGELYGKADTGFFTIDLVSVDTYVMVDNLTGGYLNGFTNNSYNLTAQYSGVYKVTAKFGIQGSGAGGENGMKLFINNVGQNNCYDHEHTTSTAPIGFIADCIIRLSAGDNVSVGFDDHQSPVNDLTALNGNLNLLRIGN